MCFIGYISNSWTFLCFQCCMLCIVLQVVWRAVSHPFVLPVNSRDKTAGIEWIPSLLLLYFLTFIHFFFWRFQTHLLFSEAFAFFYSILLAVFFFLRYFLFNSNSFFMVFFHYNLKSALFPNPAPNYFKCTHPWQLECQEWGILC